MVKYPFIMSKEGKKELRESNWEELLKEAILKWTSESNIDPNDPNNPFYKIEQDPVIKLLMMALAHETNKIKEDISLFRENLLEEFTEKVIPVSMVQPIPAFTIVQTSKAKNILNDCYASEETPFIIEKESENTMPEGRARIRDKFTFIPLLRTKIVDARIALVQNVGINKYMVRLECGDPISDLMGVSFYIANKEFSDVTVAIDDKMLPLIKTDDYEKLPFTSWFSMESVLTEKSLTFGTPEYWKDIVISNNFRFFIVDAYDTNKVNLARFGRNIDLVMEFTSPENDFRIDVNDIEINCIPLVNVEKVSVRLSKDDPIKKISEEGYDFSLIDNRGGGVAASYRKQFLHLVAGSSPESERDTFVVRRFGMERFNRKELLLQIKSIANRFRSDYYAYLENDGLRDGEKIKKLSIAMTDVLDEVKKEGEPSYGIYLILTRKERDSEQNKSIEVNYLITDGTLSNGIKTDASVKPVSTEFDKNATKILRETQGGKDVQMDKEVKRRIAQYYVLTKDRLFTKSDIRAFCYKELFSRYAIGRNSITKIDIKNKIESLSQETTRFIQVEILLNQLQGPIKNNTFGLVEDQLKKMIEIRSMNLYPVRVKVSAG
jgi:hypothetical protein